MNSVGITINGQNRSLWFYIKHDNKPDSSINIDFKPGTTKEDTINGLKSILIKLQQDNIISHNENIKRIVDNFFITPLSRDQHEYVSNDFVLRAWAFWDHPSGFRLRLFPESTIKIFNAIESIQQIIQELPIKYKLFRLHTDMQIIVIFFNGIKFSEYKIELSLEHLSDIYIMEILNKIALMHQYKLELIWSGLDWMKTEWRTFNSLGITIKDKQIYLHIVVNPDIHKDIRSIIEKKCKCKLIQSEGTEAD